MAPFEEESGAFAIEPTPGPPPSPPANAEFDPASPNQEEDMPSSKTFPPRHKEKKSLRLKGPGLFHHPGRYEVLGAEGSEEQSPAAGTPSGRLDDLEMDRRLEKLQTGGAESPDLERGGEGVSNTDGPGEGKNEHSMDRPALEDREKGGSNRFADVENAKEGSAGFDGIEEEGGGLEKEKQVGFVRRHRWALCCSTCCLFLILVLGVCAFVGYLLFRPKTPGIGVTNLRINQLSPKVTAFPPRATLSFNVTGTLTLANPNHFALRYYNTSAYVSYRDSSLATIPISEGYVPSRAERALNFSAVGQNYNVVSRFKELSSDLSSNRMPLTVNTIIPGKASVLGVIHRHFQATVLCNFTINPDSPSFRNFTVIDKTCKVKVTL